MAGEVLIVDYFGAAMNIVCQKADRGPSVLIGEEGRSWSGRLISQARGEKRTWQITTSFVPTEIKEALERITARRQQVYYAGEAMQQNPVIDPFRLDLSSWTAITTTRTPGIADPYNGLNAVRFAATGANSTVQQNLPAGLSVARYNKAWVRRNSGSGTIQILNPDGIARTTIVPSTIWQPFTIGPTAPNVTRWHGFLIATSGDSIDVYNPVMTSDPVLCSLQITGARMQAGSLLWELGLGIQEA